MSTLFQPQAIKQERPRMVIHEVSQFESFTRLKNLSVHDTQKLLLFVLAAGGCLQTDVTTLGSLFDIWEGKGRP
jgi:hypothetical protein